jgi:hypothetical protein
MNRVEVRRESVSCDLEFAACSLIEFLDKDFGVSGASSSKMPGEHEFASTLNSHEAVGISEFRISSLIVFFLAADEAPNLITLNIGHGHVSALALKQSLAAISGKYQDLHDRVLVNTSESLNRTNGATLHEHIDNTFHFLRRSVHATQVLVAWLRIRFVALAAAITLLSFASHSELSAFDPAIVARHFLPCFLQSRERK